jgi:hypothetical protein
VTRDEQPQPTRAIDYSSSNMRLAPHQTSTSDRRALFQLYIVHSDAQYLVMRAGIARIAGARLVWC